MSQTFGFTSSLSVDDCARRLTAALRGDAEIQPAERLRKMLSPRLHGNIDGNRFALQFQIAFNQPVQKLSGTLEPFGGGTRITGELSDGSARFTRTVLKIFLFVFAAFPAVAIGLSAIFGKIEKPLLAAVVPPLWAGIAWLFWLLARQSLANQEKAPVLYLESLLG